jgi:pSer/pThr/pTyr-binding forkhead associated (FHA) protein
MVARRAAPDWTPAPAYLVYEVERRAYPVRETCTIGRDTTSDVVILEPNVSRTHARIARDGELLLLESVGATGTHVNGVMVTTPQPLNDGDRIEIGTAILTLRRPPLPLGVTIVERPRAASRIDEVTGRRPTIRNPLMAASHETPHKSRRGWWIFAAVLLAIIAIVMLRA